METELIKNEESKKRTRVDGHAAMALVTIIIIAALIFASGFAIGSVYGANKTAGEPETVDPIETTASIETTEETDPTETTEAPTEVTEVPETTEPVPTVDPEELEMLACVIFQEAGGNHQCDDCRRMVADVVLNRMADPRFPDTMYEVLTEKYQYGRFYWTGIVWPERASDPDEKHAVERAYRIAEEVLLGNHSDLYGKGYVWQATFKQSNDNIYCCGHYYGRGNA